METPRQVETLGSIKPERHEACSTMLAFPEAHGQDRYPGPPIWSLVAKPCVAAKEPKMLQEPLIYFAKAMPPVVTTLTTGALVSPNLYACCSSITCMTVCLGMQDAACGHTDLSPCPPDKGAETWTHHHVVWPDQVDDAEQDHSPIQTPALRAPTTAAASTK